MTASSARNLFRDLTKEFFVPKGYTVIFSNQSRTAKPNNPLVTIRPGNAKRHNTPNEIYEGAEIEGFYLTKIPFTVDLFTNGEPVYDDETNEHIANEDTAEDEMLLFANFLNSMYATGWSNRNDVAVLIDGEVQNLTGIVNDANYEFRSRLAVNFYFTQETVGEQAGVPSAVQQQPE